MPTIPDLYFGITKLVVEKELTILGVTFCKQASLVQAHLGHLKKEAGRDLEHCGRLLINWIPQEEQLSTKLKSVALWNMHVCHG